MDFQKAKRLNDFSISTFRRALIFLNNRGKAIMPLARAWRLMLVLWLSSSLFGFLTNRFCWNVRVSRTAHELNALPLS
jgi:vacuolar-type H+-ATPase subunit I/STV1